MATIEISDVTKGCCEEADSRIQEMVNALRDAEMEIEQMLEDLCDEPDEDISAHRTLETIRAAIRMGER